MCITKLYIDVPVITSMKQIFQTEIEQEVSLDRSIGNLFEEFLKERGQPMEAFGEHAENVLISLDGEVLRTHVGGFPAKVSQILKMVIRPDQKVEFLPAVASG